MACMRMVYVRMLVTLSALEEYVRDQVERHGWTHQKLSDHLKEIYPGVKGFSVRSIERFCQEKNIHKTSRLKPRQVDTLVAGAISEVSNSNQY